MSGVTLAGTRGDQKMWAIGLFPDVKKGTPRNPHYAGISRTSSGEKGVIWGGAGVFPTRKLIWNGMPKFTQRKESGTQKGNVAARYGISTEKKFRPRRSKFIIIWG